jgi:hypothetical protein
MIFGARRNPTVVERGTLKFEAERPRRRAEDGYRGPYVASVSVTIIAIRTVSTGAAKQVSSRFDRAVILELLKAEQRRRRGVS